jgi:hypothetical protein
VRHFECNAESFLLSPHFFLPTKFYAGETQNTQGDNLGLKPFHSNSLILAPTFPPVSRLLSVSAYERSLRVPRWGHRSGTYGSFLGL